MRVKIKELICRGTQILPQSRILPYSATLNECIAVLSDGPFRETLRKKEFTQLRFSQKPSWTKLWFLHNYKLNNCATRQYRFRSGNRQEFGPMCSQILKVNFSRRTEKIRVIYLHNEHRFVLDASFCRNRIAFQLLFQPFFHEQAKKLKISFRKLTVILGLFGKILLFKNQGSQNCS